MRRIRQRSLFLALAALSVVVSACSTTIETVSTERASLGDDMQFSNLLVIGVAENYEGRSRFERKLTSELKAAGADATALYIAAGGNKPIVREAIEELVASDGYDAVLITTVLNRDTNASTKTGSAATKTIRREGRGLDLFRYDYEELNEPERLNIDLSVTLTTELFAAADSQKVWAIDSTISSKENLEELIIEASATIVRQLKKDKLISN